MLDAMTAVVQVTKEGLECDRGELPVLVSAFSVTTTDSEIAAKE